MTKLIEMGKKYKTRDGQDVRILCVDASDTHPVIALVNCNAMEFNSEGKYNYSTGCENNLDLIEESSPFSDFKKDDKVMVRVSDSYSWEKRYFSHEKDGIAYCFASGSNSWSTSDVTRWKQCRKPTLEELA